MTKVPNTWKRKDVRIFVHKVMTKHAQVLFYIIAPIPRSMLILYGRTFYGKFRPPFRDSMSHRTNRIIDLLVHS